MQVEATSLEEIELLQPSSSSSSRRSGPRHQAAENSRASDCDSNNNVADKHRVDSIKCSVVLIALPDSTSITDKATG